MEPSAVAVRAQDSAEPFAALRPRVFIVDDERCILELISKGLEEAGFQPETFTSGREFERAVVLESPDLCIMDLSLPDIDGVTILNELAQQGYRGRILLISGHSQQVLRSVSRMAEDYQLQIIGCIRKPFTMKPLLDALRMQHPSSFVPQLHEVVEAIRNEQIVVRYQPIVDLPNHQVVAAEALVRWQHPTEGLLPPSCFLGKLDHAGMNELTAYVLRNVFQHRTLWKRNGIDIALAVNVPTPILLDPLFAAELGRLMERHNAGLEGIILEITENDMMPDAAMLARVLSALCLKGARVAIDDFGTGFSSLSRLQRLPVDEVKIDKSFIRHCVTHSEDRKIVEAVIALAHALNMRVVAEGVETDATAALLAELGCDFAQGFLFGRAISPAALAGLIPH